MGKRKKRLTNMEVDMLFDKYSSPIMDGCDTESQKEKAMGISKILWLLLVTGTDTEENVHVALKKIVHNHERIISLGALYFHKMKKALTNKEIQELIKHYKDSKNFDSMKEWGDAALR